MKSFTVKVYGVPYCRHKRRGAVDAPKIWTAEVIKQTAYTPLVTYPCHLKVIFYLPEDKFPSDCPYGPDLDNLLKRLMDGLNETIFRNVVGKDSCVVRVTARKMKVSSMEKS